MSHRILDCASAAAGFTLALIISTHLSNPTKERLTPVESSSTHSACQQDEHQNSGQNNDTCETVEDSFAVTAGSVPTVTDTRATPLGPAQAEISWNASPNATRYIVWLRSDNALWKVAGAVDAPATSFVVHKSVGAVYVQARIGNWMGKPPTTETPGTALAGTRK